MTGSSGLGGIDPHAGFPQSQVAQDALDDGLVVDEGDDSHLLPQGATPSWLSFGQAISASLRFVLAVRAQEWVGCPREWRCHNVAHARLS